VCTAMTVESGDVQLDETVRAALETTFRDRSAEGLRVLALATRRLAGRPDYERTDAAEMTGRGVLVFRDPPKADAPATIATLRELGIAIKVSSGDNRHVTAHLARAVGLDASSMLTGEKIAGMRDEA